MSGWDNYGPNGTGTTTYMDVETGDITVVTDYGTGNGSIFHIKNNK